MTIPSSGPVSMDTFSVEFGKQTGVARAITEFYGAASGVPASGTISFSNMLGKSAVRKFKNVRIAFNDTGPNNASVAEIRLGLNGTVIGLVSYYSSSDYPNYPYTYAFDGNLNTRWVAGSATGAWLSLGFFNIVEFNELRIIPGNNLATNINTISIYGSNGDPVNGPWIFIKSFTNLAGAGWVANQYRVFNL